MIPVLTKLAFTSPLKTSNMLNLLQIASQNAQLNRWKEIGRNPTPPAKKEEPAVKPIEMHIPAHQGLNSGNAVQECDATMPH
jgi:hypothetical protein